MIDLKHAERRKKHWEEEIKKAKEEQKIKSKDYPNGYAIKVREDRNEGIIAMGIFLFIYLGFTLVNLMSGDIDGTKVFLSVGILIAIISIIAGIFSGKVKYKIVK